MIQSESDVEHMANACMAVQDAFATIAENYGYITLINAVAVVIGGRASFQEDPQGAIDAFMTLVRRTTEELVAEKRETTDEPG